MSSPVLRPVQSLCPLQAFVWSSLVCGPVVGSSGDAGPCCPFPEHAEPCYLELWCSTEVVIVSVLWTPATSSTWLFSRVCHVSADPDLTERASLLCMSMSPCSSQNSCSIQFVPSSVHTFLRYSLQTVCSMIVCAVVYLCLPFVKTVILSCCLAGLIKTAFLFISCVAPQTSKTL